MRAEVEAALAVMVERAVACVDRGASDELAAKQVLGYVQRHWRDLVHLGVRSVRDLQHLRVVVQGRRGGEGVRMYLRRQCSACGGDGTVAADETTPPEERRGHESRVCPYCRGGQTTVERRVTLDLRDVPTLREP